MPVVSDKSLYNYRWQQERKAFLAANPLCVFHKKRNQVVAATVVDHVIPHRGDLDLFWDKTNWQALCKPCHDSYKQAIERSGKVPGCSSSGIPIDPNHHWNRSF